MKPIKRMDSHICVCKDKDKVEIVICSSTGHYTVIRGLTKWDFIKLCIKAIFMF